MPDLSHLRIGKVPSAFAEMAEKHNELVQLIASIEAASGINIKMVSSPEKKLKVPGTSTTISRKPRGRIRIGIQPAANGQNLPTPLNELHFRYYVDQTDPNSTLLKSVDIDNTNSVSFTNNVLSKKLVMGFSEITQNMGIKEIDVCSGGVAKKMLILASDPY
jgi:hypothetical protein